jgi:hypothetical protein
MVTREDKIEQSVQDYLRESLRALDYDETLVLVREAFPTLDERAEPLEITTVAITITFDDGGSYIEVGSDLTLRVYTVDAWTFGTDETIGRNVANVLKQILESNYGNIPLKDISQDPAPVIDQLMVDKVSVTRQQAEDPQAWDEFVWSTVAHVEDTYYPSQQ